MLLQKYFRSGSRSLRPTAATSPLCANAVNLREMRYQWHPWHGERIWIRGISARGGVPVLHCSLDPNSGKRLSDDCLSNVLLGASASPLPAIADADP